MSSTEVPITTTSPTRATITIPSEGFKATFEALRALPLESLVNKAIETYKILMGRTVLTKRRMRRAKAEYDAKRSNDTLWLAPLIPAGIEAGTLNPGHECSEVMNLWDQYDIARAEHDSTVATWDNARVTLEELLVALDHFAKTSFILDMESKLTRISGGQGYDLHYNQLQHTRIMVLIWHGPEPGTTSYSSTFTSDDGTQSVSMIVGRSAGGPKKSFLTLRAWDTAANCDYSSLTERLEAIGSDWRRLGALFSRWRRPECASRWEEGKMFLVAGAALPRSALRSLPRYVAVLGKSAITLERITAWLRRSGSLTKAIHYQGAYHHCPHDSPEGCYAEAPLLAKLLVKCHMVFDLSLSLRSTRCFRTLVNGIVRETATVTPTLSPSRPWDTLRSLSLDFESEKSEDWAEPIDPGQSIFTLLPPVSALHLRLPNRASMVAATDESVYGRIHLSDIQLHQLRTFLITWDWWNIRVFTLLRSCINADILALGFNCSKVLKEPTLERTLLELRLSPITLHCVRTLSLRGMDVSILDYLITPAITRFEFVVDSPNDFPEHLFQCSASGVALHSVLSKLPHLKHLVLVNAIDNDTFSSFPVRGMRDDQFTALNYLDLHEMPSDYDPTELLEYLGTRKGTQTSARRYGVAVPVGTRHLASSYPCVSFSSITQLSVARHLGTRFGCHLNYSCVTYNTTGNGPTQEEIEWIPFRPVTVRACTCVSPQASIPRPVLIGERVCKCGVGRRIRLDSDPITVGAHRCYSRLTTKLDFQQRQTSTHSHQPIPSQYEVQSNRRVLDRNKGDGGRRTWKEPRGRDKGWVTEVPQGILSAAEAVCASTVWGLYKEEIWEIPVSERHSIGSLKERATLQAGSLNLHPPFHDSLRRLFVRINPTRSFWFPAPAMPLERGRHRPTRTLPRALAQNKPPVSVRFAGSDLDSDSVLSNRADQKEGDKEAEASSAAESASSASASASGALETRGVGRRGYEIGAPVVTATGRQFVIQGGARPAFEFVPTPAPTATSLGNEHPLRGADGGVRAHRNTHAPGPDPPSHTSTRASAPASDEDHDTGPDPIRLHACPPERDHPSMYHEDQSDRIHLRARLLRPRLLSSSDDCQNNARPRAVYDSQDD
ncbi:hypothetical protein DFP72DRAFT_851144 [Ephemerocybe angulata]|uniref:Uncharacterized protein n=1 Tax=Ephemerocybe angulata TaxID=980116 RepID=A0A8H6HRV4_9AGAR|nr:hypothetical protein DFP72DRAFT_851144 [Tulosesus angulatus]